MFSRHHDKTIIDLSIELNDEVDWQAGILKKLIYHLNICAFAFEPIAGLLAIGTTKGDIEIYGAPGVHIRVSISDHAKINLLHFATSLSRLLCVDEHDRLYVWDLVTVGKPRLQKIMNFRHPVTALTLSPSHQHAFVALANGEIQTYDLLCSRSSPYTMPNMWKLYDNKMLSRGMSSSDPDVLVSQIPVELMIHPRDLNLLFVVYGGGVILTDLTQRNTLRVYELELPPGAPGGAGYHSQDLLTHRKPSVTAFAVHPSGHFFAVGHADGSIAFWALEDEDKPLLVRTLDEDDTHVVDASKLDEVLSTPSPTTSLTREPIFKLAWSGFPNSTDPRGGETVLTVLGGLNSDEPPGLTVYLLPAFNPGEPPTPVDPAAGLHPFYRTAMRESLKPTNVHTYFTKGITQDFLLVPRDSPHFSGTWDPLSILLLSDYKGDTRAIEAYQFPPPSFAAKRPEPSTSTDPAAQPEVTSEGEPGCAIDVLSQELASTLDLMQVMDDPKQLKLPPALWSGLIGVVNGRIIVVEKDAYETFVDDRDVNHAEELRLHGGVAWVEDFQGEMKLMKLQPHRIFITYHHDLTIRFQDLSAQILVSSKESPLQHSYPSPLPALTIDLTNILTDPAIATRTSPTLLDEAEVASVYLATESLECAVVLKTGELAVYRLIDSGGSPQPTGEELISLQHIPTLPGHRFRPAFAIMANKGAVSSFAISDIGFLAVAYADGSLMIVDMRSPKIMLRYTPEMKTDRLSFLHRKDQTDPFVSLTWAVSSTSTDSRYRILLIGARTSGSSAVYSILRSQTGSWTINDPPEMVEALSNPVPGGSAVVDARTGDKCRANRSGLATIMASLPEEMEGEARKMIWVSAGAKGAKCVVNITGERIERVDWGSKAGKVESVEIVRKSGGTVLIAFTERRQALVYSLPFLELLHTLQLEQSSSEPLLVDTTGDFIELIRHPASGIITSAKYGTLFNIRRSGPYEPPSIDFSNEKRVIPAQPQPVSMGPTSYLSSWLGYITSQGMTGDQVDTLLAGPDRPIALLIPKERITIQDASAGTSASSGPGYSAQAQGIAASAATTASNLYSRLGAALAERTEGLGQLQESFDSLEQGSKKMLAQSKTLAAQQTAKRWFSF